MFQHAIFTIPNRGEGYTTDDNARALIFTVLLGQLATVRRVQKAIIQSTSRDLPCPAICRSWNMLSIRRRADSEISLATIAGGTRRKDRKIPRTRIVGARDGSGPIRRSGNARRRRTLVRVLSACGAGVQQSSRLGLQPCWGFRNISIRIREIAMRRKCGPHSAGDCSTCMSRSAARSGSGSRMLSPTETRDCRRRCS